MVPLLFQVLHRPHQDEVEQAVRVIARIASHEIERVTPDARRRDELAERDRRGIWSRSVRDSEQQTGVGRIEDATERHRETPLHPSTPALHHHVAQGGGQSRIGTGRIVERNRVSVLGDPVHRLAEALLGPSLEGELSYVDDDCLVADVQIPHPRGLVHRQPLLTGTEDGDRPSVLIRETAERRPERRALFRRTDRVRRHEADAVVHGVGDHPVPVEEVHLVASQREVVERAAGSPLNDLTGVVELSVMIDSRELEAFRRIPTRRTPGVVTVREREAMSPEAPLRDRPEAHDQSDEREADAYRELSRVQEDRCPMRQGDRVDPDEPLDASLESSWPRERVVVAEPDRELDHCRARDGDAGGSAEHGRECRADGSRLVTAVERTPRPDKRSEDGDRDDRCEDLAVPHYVQHRGEP